jgi:hypothetical protein
MMNVNDELERTWKEEFGDCPRIYVEKVRKSTKKKQSA